MIYRPALSRYSSTSLQSLPEAILLRENNAFSFVELLNIFPKAVERQKYMFLYMVIYSHMPNGRSVDGLGSLKKKFDPISFFSFLEVPLTTGPLSVHTE